MSVWRANPVGGDEVNQCGHPVDRTLHALPDASPAEFAEAVNAIFRHHFGLSETYELSGYRER